MSPYNIIYADPPWNYKVWSKDTGIGRSAESHYKTMSIEDIYKLPVKSICDKNAALFLWVTYPLLPEGLQTLKSWGFEYKTVAFTWAKTTAKDKYFMGLGYWTRANPEICLLGTRGNMKRIDAGVRNLQVHKVREHSRKPDEIRGEIVRLLGDLPRIELFARSQTQGWDVFGNEVEGSIRLLTPRAADAIKPRR